MNRRMWVGSGLAVALVCSVEIGAQSNQSGDRTQSASGQNSTVVVTGCLRADEGSGSATSGTSGSTSSTSGANAGQFVLANARMSGGAGSSSRTGGSTSGSTSTTTSGTSTTDRSSGTSTTDRSSSGSTSTTDRSSGSGTSTTDRLSSGDLQSGSSASMGTSYVLEGNSAELTPHKGHEVEITGVVDMSGAGSGSASGSTASTDSGSRAAGSSTSTSGSTSSESGANRSGMQQRLRVQSVRMISANCSR